jgi:haloalkane dehalogenase
MRALRTPDDRFENLPGWTFAPRYTEVPDGEGGTLRVHHVDEGPASANPVLCMHGEPSWAYLYRKMIPVFTGAGYRAVAPDLVGFGRSDKPTELDDYTYQRHVDWMTAWLDAVDLEHATLVCQDWGALIGLRLLAENPDRFDRVVVANGFLPTGDAAPGEAFLRWREYSQTTPNFHVGGIIKGGCRTELSEDVIAAYDAPFPDDSYKAGARAFPSLVPTSPDDPAHDANTAAWHTLRGYERPFLCAFSDSDPITRGGEAMFIGQVPGTAGQPHTTIEGAGHFLQEDKGEQLAQLITDFIAAT